MHLLAKIDGCKCTRCTRSAAAPDSNVTYGILYLGCKLDSWNLSQPKHCKERENLGIVLNTI